MYLLKKWDELSCGIFSTGALADSILPRSFYGPAFVFSVSSDRLDVEQGLRASASDVSDQTAPGCGGSPGTVGVFNRTPGLSTLEARAPSLHCPWGTRHPQLGTTLSGGAIRFWLSFYFGKSKSEVLRSASHYVFSGGTW